MYAGLLIFFIFNEFILSELNFFDLNQIFLFKLFLI